MVDGRRLHLDVFGLYNAVMVMSDRETGSIWSLQGGNALDGPMKGAEMEFIPVLQTTWEEWRKLHPGTLVLSNDTPYQKWYANTPLGAPGLGQGFIRSIVNWDDRLTYNQVVLGVAAGGDSKAYPLDVVAQSGGVVNDILGDQPIVVFVDPDSSLSVAYSRRVAGRVLDFRNAGESGLEIVDEQTGSNWTPEGLAVSGPLEGESLTWVTSFLTEWYGWSAYHPGTPIFDAESESPSGSGNPHSSNTDTPRRSTAAPKAYCTSFERLGAGCNEDQDRLP